MQQNLPKSYVSKRILNEYIHTYTYIIIHVLCYNKIWIPSPIKTSDKLKVCILLIFFKFLVPITVTVDCGQGSITTLYADGLDISEGAGAVSGGVPKDVEVIAVECKWPDSVVRLHWIIY